MPGRPKTIPMRAFLSERIQGFDPGGSKPELDVRRTIERAGYPAPIQQFVVIVEGFKYKLDHAYPETMHCLEFEGFWAHGQYTPFHRDRANPTPLGGGLARDGPHRPACALEESRTTEHKR